jgi:hypothetical protein
MCALIPTILTCSYFIAVSPGKYHSSVPDVPRPFPSTFVPIRLSSFSLIRSCTMRAGDEQYEPNSNQLEYGHIETDSYFTTTKLTILHPVITIHNRHVGVRVPVGSKTFSTSSRPQSEAYCNGFAQSIAKQQLDKQLATE